MVDDYMETVTSRHQGQMHNETIAANLGPAQFQNPTQTNAKTLNNPMHLGVSL